MCFLGALCTFTWSSRLVDVRELFDRKDPLFFIVLHIFPLDCSEQTQVVFFLSFGLTEVPKLAGGAMFVQDEGRWLGRRSCGPFLQGSEQWEKDVSALPYLYLVRDAIHSDNLPVFRKLPLDLP